MDAYNLQQIGRDDWPDLIKDIAEVIGDESAMAMFIRFAGRHLHVPRFESKSGDIEATIGLDKAKLLYERYGADQLLFPNGRLILVGIRNQRIIKEWVGGVSVTNLSTKYALTERHIGNIVNKTSLNADKATASGV